MPTVTTAVRERIALTLLVLSVVVVLPGGMYPYYLPKLALAAAAIVAAALAPRTGRLPRSIVLVLAAGSVVLLVAAFVSGNPLPALLGRWPRYEGLVALPVYLGLLWAGARLLGPGATSGTRRFFTTGLSLASVAIAALYLLEVAGLRPLGGIVGDRTGSFLGNATDAGLVGAALLVTLVGSATTSRRAVEAAGAVAALVTIVLSASRAGLLAAAVALVILAGLVVVRHRGRWLAALAVPTGALAVLAATALLVPQTASRVTGTSPLATATVENRVLAWGDTMAMLDGRWLLGVGPSGFSDRITAEQGQDWADAVGFDSAIDSPHTIVLQAASAGGVLLVAALVLLGVFGVLAFSRGLRAAADDAAYGRQGAAVAAAIGVAVGLLTHFTTISVLALVLVIAGGAVAVPIPVPVRLRGAPALPARPGGIAAARTWLVAGVLSLVVLVPAAFAELPMRAAEAATLDGDAPAFGDAASAVRALRPWDADSVSNLAQLAAAVVNSSPDAGVRSTFGSLAVDLGTDARGRLGGAAAPTLATAIGYTAANQYDEALPFLDELVEASPYNASLLVRRGTALAFTGHLDEARADFVRALGIDPANGVARDNLQVLDAEG